jgi:DNA-binding Xre family transcriptional regulator
MSVECSDCEHDLRRGHHPKCRYFKGPKPVRIEWHKLARDLKKLYKYEESVRDTAAMTGLSPATVSRVANGKSADTVTYLTLCRHLNVEPLHYVSAVERWEGETP